MPDILTKNEIINYLSGDTEPDRLFRLANEKRKQIFGDKIFLYGFVYFSTFCRNNCNFCYFRKDNDIVRYRKTKEEALDIAVKLAESGVSLIDLTMGEDPVFHGDDFESAVFIIRNLKKLGVPVMVSAGVADKKIIDLFYEAGADWYALYQETHNRQLFAKLRTGQSYDERMECKLYAGQKGMLIEEGILSGAGEDDEDLAESIIQMGAIGASQIRVMSFIPQRGSPMETFKGGDRIREYKTIALMRLLYPKALIPASCDIDGVSGLRNRILAGANVVTSVIPPGSGLMGVARSTMDVDEGGRTFGAVQAVLEEMGLAPASREEYKSYIGGLK